MNQESTAVSNSPFRIHPATRIGHVHLTVADLEREVEFYQSIIGLQMHWREEKTAGMGAGGEDILRLSEDSQARTFSQPGGIQGGRRTTGLYHMAILFPSRRELARVVARLYSRRYSNYPTDHIMTKTTYLDDPEGNGIELYADTPEDGFFGVKNGVFYARRADGTPSDGREPLDVEALLRELQPNDSLEDPAPGETKMGHVHLHVANLAQAYDFYHNLLGFDDMGLSTAFRAGFVSAGGYHHHIAFNTWAGEGAPPPPEGAPGLRYFSVVLPDERELEGLLERVRETGLPVEEMKEGFLVRDPAKNGVLLTIQ